MRLDGQKVRAARIAKGLSRERLAELSKGGPHEMRAITIKRIERGEAVYLNTAYGIAALLSVALQEFDPAAKGGLTPARPMIAVLRLRAAGDDTQLLAEGLSDELNARLCRFWFPVISRESSIVASNEPPRDVARALGAKYWIGGAVDRRANMLRVTAELADATNGAIVAQHSHERPFGDMDQLLKEITAAILADLGPGLVEAEVERFGNRNPENLDAWQEALVGLWHFYRRTRADNARARKLLQEALGKDPHMPLAWYALALTHQQDVIHQWTENAAASVEALGEVSREVERRYPDDAATQVACAYFDVYKGARERAMTRLSAAIETDPNTCLAYSLYGQTLAMGREPDRGLEQFEMALRLNPRDVERWSTHTGIALAHFVAARYEETVAAANEALRVRPNAAFPYTALASASAHLGRLEEARAAVRAMRYLQPNMSARGIVAVMGSTDGEISERYLEGLRLAGLSD